jgi:DNA-binding transcriptional LysR family regulator
MDGELLQRRVARRCPGDGQLIFNTLALRVSAAIAGLGLAYLPEDHVRAHVADGRLVTVLDEWCSPFPGYHLYYYPSRRQTTPAAAASFEASAIP